MHARLTVPGARYATSTGTAAYVGRSRQWVIDHLGPYLHEMRLGGERMYDLREVDEVLRRLATAPREVLPAAPGADEPTPRRGPGRPRRGGRPHNPVPSGGGPL